MVVTVLKTKFPKAEPKIVYYRDYKNFDLYNFRTDLREQLRKTTEKDYFHFELIFLKQSGKTCNCTIDPYSAIAIKSSLNYIESSNLGVQLHYITI